MSVCVCALWAGSTADLSVWASGVCWGWRQGLRVQRAYTLMCAAGSGGTTAPAPVTGDLVTLCWFMCVTVARPRNLSTYSPPNPLPIPTVTSPCFLHTFYSIAPQYHLFSLWLFTEYMGAQIYAHFSEWYCIFVPVLAIYNNCLVVPGHPNSGLRTLLKLLCIFLNNI